MIKVETGASKFLQVIKLLPHRLLLAVGRRVDKNAHYFTLLVLCL